MKLYTSRTLLLTVGILVFLLVAVGCQTAPGSMDGTLEIPSGREPNAVVSGTVTYRERIALTPGARLVVELRDVSLQDAAAPLIARQTIESPGQVPIAFNVEYNRDDINSRNTYAIQAKIIESDGRLAFINDTAYDVITRGNPTRVDMLLVLVEPPPDQIEEGQDWRTWVEAPAPVLWANLIPNEADHFLRIAYYQSTIEGCARPGNEGLSVAGTDIIARVTLMQPPPTSWAISCHEQVVELDTVLPVDAALEPEQTYRVIVNDRITTTFSLPRVGFPASEIRESPIEHTEIEVLERTPTEYQLRVVSGMPSGSCSHFNGFEIRRDNSNAIDVRITHHYVVDRDVACTMDYPIIETVVPLGSDFEQGVEYTVSVNGENSQTFVAR
ncbi:MAG: YbaY family lipoprotein [Chloroflexi bacterium]|nr:YbaY family lipoprotein [Chloroflexota bacterium]